MLMRVLIITYYWPPSGGGGVQRWYKLSKYLPNYGIQPIIYTPALRRYALRDDSLVEELPEVQVWRRPIWEPYAYFRRLLRPSVAKESLQQGFLPRPGLSLMQRLGIWVRAHFFVPDPRVLWVRPSVRFLCKRLREESVDIVITTGPPHSMHLIGLGLQRRLGLPWWADFRDCWTRWEMLLALRPNAIAMAIHRRLERKVLRTSDKIITVSQRWAKDFRHSGAKKTLVIPNGYDEADLKAFSFTSETPSEAPHRTTSTPAFRLLHIGNLGVRSAAYFWEAFLRFCAEESDALRPVELILGGVLDMGLVRRIEQAPEVRTRVHLLGYVPHQSVFHYYAQASVLLLFSHISPSMEGQIPGKLFEYLALRRPILFMGSATGETAALLRSQQAGLCVNYKDTDAIIQALHRLYREEEPFLYKETRHFSRHKQAEVLAQALKASA